MSCNRRNLLGLGAVAAALTAALPATAQRRTPHAPTSATELNAAALGVMPERGTDQTRALQSAIDMAARRKLPLVLAPGRYVVGKVSLPSGMHLKAASGEAVLMLAGQGAGLQIIDGADVRITGLTLDGAAVTGATASALVAAVNVHGLVLEDVTIRNARANGVRLERVSGRVEHCHISAVGQAAIFSVDARGLTIADNDISACGNNGILVWQSKKRADGTRVSGNRIRVVRADSGGSGQNGNGVNVFRAGDVIVSGNHISDCAYSAVRGNAADNISIQTNTCRRIGEVALYAEFGFQGALIANNIVDGAATGIVATNFNEGGRLAVIQGNLVRNLTRREHEPVDKRGNGIGIEADAAVTGNTIEGAPTAGIVVGWGRWMRNVNVTGNTVRGVGIGIAVTGDIEAGHALVAHNLIAEARRGGVRTMRQAEAFGPELAGENRVAGRLTLSGNVLA